MPHDSLRGFSTNTLSAQTKNMSIAYYRSPNPKDVGNQWIIFCNKKHKTEAEEKMRGKSEPLNDWKETLCLCVVCGESQSLHFDMERARKRNRAGNLNDFFCSLAGNNYTSLYPFIPQIVKSQQHSFFIFLL